MPRKRWLPKWVTEFEDRHGKRRYRFRRKGFQKYLFKNAPGTEGFRQEYEGCKNGVEAEPIIPGIDRAMPGSFDDLIGRYYRSPGFLDPGDRTRVVYRGVIDRWRETVGPNGRRYGTSMVRHLQARHVEAMMQAVLPHRTAANMLRKRLAALMKFAIRQGMANTNPVLATRPYKVTGDGFHSWSEDEIAKFETRHEIGTKARLAFDLMIWTGQRGGDARIMGPQHIREKRLMVTQEKTGATVSLRALPPLAESIMAARTGALVFLLSEQGRPFSRKGFGNKFRQWCDEAGLPHCSAHGLRKAAARRLAEAGCSNQEIKAWTGHTTDSEVGRYTKAADQIVLSDAAGERSMANLRTRLAIGNDNALESKA